MACGVRAANLRIERASTRKDRSHLEEASSQDTDSIADGRRAFRQAVIGSWGSGCKLPATRRIPPGGRTPSAAGRSSRRTVKNRRALLSRMDQTPAGLRMPSEESPGDSGPDRSLVPQRRSGRRCGRARDAVASARALRCLRERQSDGERVEALSDAIWNSAPQASALAPSWFGGIACPRQPRT
jgi:hypothetical protein